jgi:flagellar biosynthetic protein FliO
MEKPLLKPIWKVLWIILIAGCLAPLGRCAEDANTVDALKSFGTTPATPWKGFGISNDKLPKQTDLFRQFATAIGFVAVLGAGAFYISRRMGPRWNPSRGRHLRIIESIGLGPHRQIHLLEVDGRRLVVGSTAQAIGLIAEIHETAEPKGNGPL